MGKTAMFFVAVLIVVAGPCMSQTKSDIIPPPPGLGITQRNVDHARFWSLMPETEKDHFLAGIRSGMMISLMMLGDIKDIAEEDGDLELSQSVSDASELLKTGVFSVGGNMISLKEFRLRIDLFYLDGSNKYEQFEKAIYDAIMHAARE